MVHPRNNRSGSSSGRVDHRLDSPDNVYLDASIVNYNPTKVINASYSSTRSNPIVDKCNDYYLCVARFEIPNDGIPLFQFRDDAYLIEMRNAGVTASRFVQFIPDYLPSPSTTGTRGVYRVQDFINMINATLTLVAADLGIADVPQVWMNRENQIQYFRFSNSANWRGANPTWQLWMNWDLYEFFRTLSIIYDPVGSYSGATYRVVVQDNLDGNVKEYPAGSGTIIYDMGQEVGLLSNYVTIHSIVVSTTGIPINPENISIFREQNVSGQSDSSTFNVITDFIPGEMANFADNFTPYVYNPAFYRLVDLNSNDGLKKFDFQIFYTDRYRNFYPVQLLPNQQITVKFLFVKKSLYNNEYS